MSNIDRIRKLLALADDGANANESDLARRMAEKLMEAAGISEDEINGTDSEDEDPAASVCRYPDPSMRGGETWELNAAGAVAKMIGCRVYRNGEGRLIWVGTQLQRDGAIAMYRWAMKQVADAVKAAQVPAGESPRSYMAAFRVGVAIGLRDTADRLASDRKAAAPTTTTALARRASVDSAIAKHLPPLHSARASVGNGAGFAAGRFTGQGVQFRANVGTGTGAKRLS